MVKVKEDLTGWEQPNGRLVVVRQTDDYISPSGQHFAQWLCRCKCGNTNLIPVTANNLKRNHTTSCGCLQKERASENNIKPNIYDLDSQEYGIGYTSKQEPFWFDKEDYKLISSYSGWYYDASGYVVSKNINGIVFLHRLVMRETDKALEINHKQHPPRNEHKIDNRKSNLEVVTRSQNNMNSVIPKNNTSGTTGVYWNKRDKKWYARITVDYKNINLGYFDNIDEAIIARKTAEIKYFGEYRYDANN